MPKRKGINNSEINLFESLGPTEIYKCLRYELDLMHGHAGSEAAQQAALPAVVIGRGFDKAYRARRIERFLRVIEENHDEAFKKVTRADGRAVLVANEVGECFDDIMGINLPHEAVFEFSEEVGLVLRVFRETGVATECLTSPESVDQVSGRLAYAIFNDAVKRVRTALREEGFLKRRRRRREQGRRNYISSVRYISDLFKRYARLLVLRVDFGYRDWANPKFKFEARKKTDDIRRDLMRLLNNRRSNGLFDAMVGYIAKIEEGTSKGFHAHVVLFFDGSRVKSDAWLAAQIGEYWNTTITKGEGLFYNCNAHKSRYRRLGIGRIDHDDCEKRDNLLLAVAYLTKAEQYFRVRDDGRTFFKGVVKPRTTAAGRPRRKNGAGTESPAANVAGDFDAFPPDLDS